MSVDLQKTAKLFKALSDPNRLAILELLQGGEKCACVLLEKLNVTQSGLSYHMKILCEAGIVASRQDGKWTHYRLDDEGRENALALLRQITTPNLQQAAPCRCEKSGEAD